MADQRDPLAQAVGQPLAAGTGLASLIAAIVAKNQANAGQRQQDIKALSEWDPTQGSSPVAEEWASTGGPFSTGGLGGIVGSGPIGEELKYVSKEAPAWLHFLYPEVKKTALPVSPEELAKVLADSGKLVFSGKNIPPEQMLPVNVKRLPPNSPYGFEPGTLSTTVRPDLSAGSHVVAGSPRARQNEMGETMTRDGILALTDILYPSFSKTRFRPSSVFAEELNQWPKDIQALKADSSWMNDPDSLIPWPPPETGLPELPSDIANRINRVLKNADTPLNLEQLQNFSNDLGLFPGYPTPKLTEGILGHYLRRLATRELSKQGVKAIVQEPRGEYNEYETTLVDPSVWRLPFGKATKPVERDAVDWTGELGPVMKRMDQLSREHGGGGHSASSAGRRIIEEIIRAIQRGGM